MQVNLVEFHLTSLVALIPFGYLFGLFSFECTCKFNIGAYALLGLEEVHHNPNANLYSNLTLTCSLRGTDISVLYRVTETRGMDISVLQYISSYCQTSSAIIISPHRTNLYMYCISVIQNQECAVGHEHCSRPSQ
jgi:hypothetical protein